MSKEKNHLDVNLDFLDKKSSVNKNTSAPKSKSSSTEKQISDYNWTKIIIIGGIVLLFGWIVLSNDSTTDDNLVVVGNYSCSRHHYNQSVSLDPDESEQQIDAAISAMDKRTNELDRLDREINNSYVNEYSSQYQINQYNIDVNEYNSMLTTYKQDSSRLDKRIDKYNAQTETHNSYLIDNCTPN